MTHSRTVDCWAVFLFSLLPISLLLVLVELSESFRRRRNKLLPPRVLHPASSNSIATLLFHTVATVDCCFSYYYTLSLPDRQRTIPLNSDREGGFVG